MAYQYAHVQKLREKDPDDLSESEIRALYFADLEEKDPESLTDTEMAQLLKWQNGEFSMGEPEEITVLKEEDPSVSNTAARALYKTLGTGDRRGYLKLMEEFPDLDFAQTGGDVVYRKKGTNEWRYLDSPSRTTLMDLVDIIPDVASGAAEIGGAFIGSAGGLPGMVAGAGAGAGLIESLRQGIGKLAGYTDFQPGLIAENALWGAGGSALMGSGATNKMIGKKALKSGATGEALDKKIIEIAKNQRGIPSRVVSKIGGKYGPKIQSFLLEMDEDILRDVYRRAGQLDRDSKITPILRELSDKVTGKVKEYKFQKGQELSASVENLTGGIPADYITEPLDNLINQYEKEVAKARSYVGDAADKSFNKKRLDELRALKKGLNIYDEIIMSPDGAQQFVPYKKAVNIKREINDIMTNPSDQVKESYKNVSERELTRVGNKIIKRIDDMIDLTPAKDQYRAANKAWREAASQEKLIFDKFDPKDMQKTEQTLSSLLSKHNKEYLYETLGDIDKQFGTNILNEARYKAGRKAFIDPPWMPPSRKGVTSTAITTPLAAGGGLLGYQVASKDNEQNMWDYILPPLFATGGVALRSPRVHKMGFQALNRPVTPFRPGAAGIKETVKAIPGAVFNKSTPSRAFSMLRDRNQDKPTEFPVPTEYQRSPGPLTPEELQYLNSKLRNGYGNTP